MHFRGSNALHNICEFYLSDQSREPQLSQNSILVRSKAKIGNWKIKKNCFCLYICAKPFSLTKNEGKVFLVPKSSGPFLAGLPLCWFSTQDYGSSIHSGYFFLFIFIVFSFSVKKSFTER